MNRDEATTERRGIVVGYDGSEHSRFALDWAAAEAARRGVPLTVASALDVAVPIQGFGTTTWLHREAGQVFAGPAHLGAVEAHRAWPQLRIHEVSRAESAVHLLVELSAAAELVVVGSRGHGEVAGRALGSVARAVSARAHCPVTVIPAPAFAHPGPRHAVLVGVDGSGEARSALRYAAALAAGADAPLTILTVVKPAAADTWVQAYGSADFEDADLAADRAAAVAAAAADEAGRRHPGLEIRRHVVTGTPAEILADASRSHAVVVVGGSRERGRFAVLLLGSVRRALIQRASCPVAVVPPAGSPVPSA
jgi:nucleotide-binding universal stress UspA family protein